jgi:hypothetical protein
MKLAVLAGLVAALVVIITTQAALLLLVRDLRAATVMAARTVVAVEVAVLGLLALLHLDKMVVPAVSV